MSGARLAPGSGLANVATGRAAARPPAGRARAAQAASTSRSRSSPDEPAAEVDAAGDGARSGARSRCSAAGTHGDGVMLSVEALAMVVVEASGTPLVASNADLTGAGGLGTDLAGALPLRARRRGGADRCTSG